jgi:hypothetical protein
MPLAAKSSHNKRNNRAAHMFGFLTAPTKDDADPLISARSVSTWLRQLPTQDVIARQHQVMRVFDGMRQSARPVDHNRVAAIQFLDTALGADRRQLVKQYVENLDRSSRVADRGWQAAQEMSQGFVYAYQTSLERALADTSNPRWKPIIPQLFARLLHYHGTDAKLRAFRHERWIPAKWTNLHQLYARAVELGVAEVTVALPSAGPGAMQWSTEQEYIYALLIQQLNMGSLSPAEIDWASAQVRAWGRKLEFETVPARRRASTSISRASAGSCAGRATNRDPRSTSSTRHRSPTSSSARCTRSARRTSASPAGPPPSTCSASPSSKKCVPSSRPTCTAISAVHRGCR